LDHVESMGEGSQAVLAKDESTLVSEAKSGNFSAFEELVNRYEKKIYRLGLNVTGNPEDAEEVLQETFLKAFQHLANFREDSRFYTWIVRIAVNEGLMKLRKRRSDKSVPIADDVDEKGSVIPREFADWRPNPEEQLAQSELESILSNAARSLPPTFVQPSAAPRGVAPRRASTCTRWGPVRSGTTVAVNRPLPVDRKSSWCASAPGPEIVPSTPASAIGTKAWSRATTSTLKGTPGPASSENASTTGSGASEESQRSAWRQNVS